MNSSGNRVGTHRSPSLLSMEELSADAPEPSESAMRIAIADQQSLLTIRAKRMRAVVGWILEDARVTSGTLSIAIVDDPAIHRLNRRYLQHDWPTDVLSFPLECRIGYLEGEVVVSADTAARMAAELSWSGEEELLLYVVHGTLHLVGFRDKEPEEVAKMRAAELEYLRRAGVEVAAGDDRWRRVDYGKLF